MKVSTLKSRTSTVWIEVPGDGNTPSEKVWVKYRPGNLTLEVSEKIQEATLSGLESEAIFVLLENLLDSWDLEAEDGTPLGVKAGDIKQIPLSFLGEIMTAIESDARPNPQRGVTSDAGSPQAGQ